MKLAQGLVMLSCGSLQEPEVESYAQQVQSITSAPPSSVLLHAGLAVAAGGDLGADLGGVGGGRVECHLRGVAGAGRAGGAVEGAGRGERIAGGEVVRPAVDVVGDHAVDGAGERVGAAAGAA